MAQIKSQIIDCGWGTKVEVCWNEFNNKTKKGKQVNRTVTQTHIQLINRQLDSTDCGTFLEEKVGNITLRGYFELISN